MPDFLIQGGAPLYGSVRVSGAKNASYKLMIAALLADSPSRLLNFSHISDVALVANVINQLGGKAELVGERAYMISPTTLNQFTIDSSHGEVSRASTLFIPVLLARFGEAIVPLPGGDKIGARPLERHFDGLEALGATIEVRGDAIHVRAPQLRGARYKFEKNSHTGTETLIMAALRANGTTILENAAEENEIDDLITFCNSMGGKVRRKPGRMIEIEGVPQLHGAIHKVMPDHNQVVSFACAALATKGDIIIEDAVATHLQAFIDKLDEIGAGYQIGNYGIRFFWRQPLKANDVTTEIYPGFKTDWQPLWVTMMTQAQGISTLHETVYESRFAYVESLQKMGAQIEQFNPEVKNPEEVYNFNLADEKPGTFHAIKIHGPRQLFGGEFMIKDLRHGATLIVAGLVADGITTLHDPENQVARGYEQFAERLETLGARIEKKE